MSQEHAFSPAGMEIIAETPSMKFTRFHLPRGEAIPWHIHTHVTDWYVCQEGRMRVATSPGRDFDLQPGGMCEVRPKTAHHVVNTGDGECRFVLVQGVGTYDFLPLEA